MRVSHFGNTANNAYYNVRLLAEYANIESNLPVRMFGLRHAMSAPAWEAIDFEVPSAAWVAQPDWSSIPGASSVNAEYSDLGGTDTTGTATATAPAGRSLGARAMSMAGTVITPLHGKRWAQPIFDLSYGLALARRPVHAVSDRRIDVLYGADSVFRLRMPRPSRQIVCLEHGTVRWIAEGGREAAVLRRAYRKEVEQTTHLWVTNLDPRTLEIAEDVAPGRWSALPHPFMPDPRVPFPVSMLERQSLLSATGSSSLVFLPSSQNWSKHHDKGSIKALSAFVELRRKGLDVGLVAVEWGLQLDESKAFLDDAGVGNNVVWKPPMSRFGLQRLMADVDVVWDQFGLDAFGALALRVVEQGTPLVSRGLAPIGEQLIGGPVPWRPATTIDQIVHETSEVLEDMSRRGRETVVAETTSRYRAWLLNHHSPALTAALQRSVYEKIFEGTFEPGTAAPDQWAKLLHERLG